MARVQTFLRMNVAELIEAGQEAVEAHLAHAGLPLHIEDMTNSRPPQWAEQLAEKITLRGKVTKNRNGSIDPTATTAFRS